jgi:hypothetical protein
MMEYRNLGESGCAVSAFALGTMTFGDHTDEAGALAQLDAFAEAGGTLVDTANLPIGLQLSTEETALLDEVSAPRVDYPYGGAIVAQMTRRIEGGWPT